VFRRIHSRSARLASFKRDERVDTEVHKARATKLCMVAPKIYVTAKPFGKFVETALLNE